MAEAEAIAWDRGFRKMAVIAGIGTRNYYRKLGYHLEETFLVKKLRSPTVTLLLKKARAAMARTEHQILAVFILLLLGGILFAALADPRHFSPSRR